MGVFFDEPKYPVIDKAPKFWKTGDPDLYLYLATSRGLCIVTNEVECKFLTPELVVRSWKLQFERLWNRGVVYRLFSSLWLLVRYILLISLAPILSCTLCKS